MAKQLFLLTLLSPLITQGSTPAPSAAPATSSNANASANSNASATNPANFVSSAASDQKETKAQLDSDKAQTIVDWLVADVTAAPEEFTPYFDNLGNQKFTAHHLMQRYFRAHNHTDPAGEVFLEAFCRAEQQDRHPLIQVALVPFLPIYPFKLANPAYRKCSIGQLQLLMEYHWLGCSVHNGAISSDPVSLSCRTSYQQHDHPDGSFMHHVRHALDLSRSDLREGLVSMGFPQELWSLILGYTGAFGVQQQRTDGQPNDQVIVDEQFRGVSIGDCDRHCKIEDRLDDFERRLLTRLNFPHRGIASCEGLADIIKRESKKPGVNFVNIDLHGNRLTALDKHFLAVILLRPPSRRSHYRLIDLSCNRIRSVCKGLKNIREINLRENCLETLPEAFEEQEFLATIRCIHLQGNPLLEKPEEMEKIKRLRERGIEVLTDYPPSPADIRARNRAAAAANASATASATASEVAQVKPAQGK